MADVSQIKLPDGNTYNIKDNGASTATNWVNGSATNSVRTTGSASEDSGYTIGIGAVAEGYGTQARGNYSHAEGQGSIAKGENSHAEGLGTTANGSGTHAEGLGTTASSGSHAEGASTTASGQYSHAEGAGTQATSDYSHAEGASTLASGSVSHAEGSGTIASGSVSHAEGQSTTASGLVSHAEGSDSVASGTISHAEGTSTTASGLASHAEGSNTIANHMAQHVFGVYNIADSSAAASTLPGNYIEIVGNGTSTSARSNARTLDWSGNEVLAGKLTVGVAGTNSMDVATVGQIPTVPSNIVNTITTTAGAHTAISNQTGNVSFNVPTNTSHLTNDSGFITSYTETDPIFSASPAAGITATDISNWNSKSNTDEKVKAIPLSANGFFYPVFGSNSNNSETKNYIDSFKIGYSDSVSLLSLYLGNSTTESRILLYGGIDADTYTIIEPSSGYRVLLGLPSKSGTIALTSDNINTFYGTCTDTSDTVAKTVTLSSATGWQLKAGVVVGVKFTNTNTAQNPTLNINNSGAQSIYVNNATVTTSNLWYAGEAERVHFYMYDGTYWVFMGHSYDWNSDTKVTLTALTPPASVASYFPTFHTAASGTTGLNTTDNYYLTIKDGTTSANGYVYICAGNSTASGTAGNMIGGITLYGTGSYYTDIKSGSPTANRFITLPDKTGTVALTSDLLEYLPLTGGNVTGPVSFGDSVSIDEATLGDLVVNGNISFANAKTITNQLIDTLDIATANWTDNTLILTSDATGDTNLYYRRAAVRAWNYIKSKLDSSLTANKLVYANSSTQLTSIPNIAYFTGSSTASTPATYYRLHLHGATYGNTAANMISNTAGLFSFGDGGPQITFDTSATPGEGQAGALIYTDNDNAGTGVSWHFVSNQTDWNVTSKRFHARTGISIGSNLPVTSHALYVTGHGAFTGSFYTGTKRAYNDGNAGWYIGADGTAWCDHNSTAGAGIGIMNAAVQYSRLYISTIGTTSVAGATFLMLGNGTATGTANNSQGYLRLYGSNTGYANITYINSTSNSTATLPAVTGNVLVGSGTNISGKVTVSTSAPSGGSSGDIWFVYA